MAPAEEIVPFGTARNESRVLVNGGIKTNFTQLPKNGNFCRRLCPSAEPLTALAIAAQFCTSVNIGNERVPSRTFTSAG